MSQAKPIISKQPASISVAVGSPVTLSATASATPPPTFQWFHDGAAIPHATSSSFSIAAAALGDAGEYYCVVSNRNGSTTSSTAKLAVQVPAAPAIVAQPLSITMNEGGSVSLSVTASGAIPLVYQWKKDGANLAGATSATYTIDTVTPSDAGSYTASVTNLGGSVISAPAILVVLEPMVTPTITTQPVAVSVSDGAPATFSVSATGTAPIGYQWMKDGVVIDGATDASLTIDAAASGDAGAYSVVVSNPAGAVESQSVSLTVIPADTLNLAAMTAAERMEYLLGSPCTDTSIAPATHALTPPKNPLTEIKTDGSTVTSNISLRIQPYQIGSLDNFNHDYWSDAGSIPYIPAVFGPGLRAIQLDAFYNGCHATSPRSEPNFKVADPAPSSTRAEVIAANGGVAPSWPITVARPIVVTSNGGVVLSSDGLIYADSTHTGSAGTAKTNVKLPPTKIPLDLCVTHGNELILVAVHDTERDVGQLAVVMVEAKNIPAHTLHVMGLNNRGSYTDFKLLGYVDLPVKWPTRIAAGSNGLWRSPSETAGLDQGYIPIDKTMTLWATSDVVAGPVHIAQVGDHLEMSPVTDTAPVKGIVDRAVLAKNPIPNLPRPTGVVEFYDSARWAFSLLNGTTVQSSWNRIIAKGGCAVVTSLPENKVVFMDLEPLFTYIWSWIIDVAHYDANAAGRLIGAWPQTFDQNSSIMPVVDSVFDVDSPVSVLCGSTNTQNGNTDKIKAYVALRDGTLINYDASKLMARSGGSSSITELGRNFVGLNPVHLTWTRHNDGAGDAIFPSGQTAGGYHSALYVTCRGERSVKKVVTYMGAASVLSEISDSRLKDPVAACVGERIYVIAVADHEGKQVVGFRTTSITDSHRTPTMTYPVTDPSGIEVTGVLPIAGKPVGGSVANVN